MSTSDIAIRVDNLGKRYKLGQTLDLGMTFREALMSAPRRLIHNIRELIRPTVIEHDTDTPAGTFWALQDVSFDIEHGEVVGIIGRNGAGKSTLLKVLSRITTPTTGRAELHGRLASLLEVGTGFHPELTGRENIFLNGAILGMRRTEIQSKFDEIVAFAEVDQFLDTPVKRYSSGMYVRLAFAVAAHLEPEILLVDEVLAVGDMAFQKKCLGKMDDVARQGRTVLFVSHNMAAVENLCRRGIVLQHGGVAFMGSQTEAISHYLRANQQGGVDLAHRTDRRGSGEVRVTRLELRDAEGHVLEDVACGACLEIWLHFERDMQARVNELTVTVRIRTVMDLPVFLINNLLTGQQLRDIPVRGVFILSIASLPLPPQSYKLAYTIVQERQFLDRLDDALEFMVGPGDYFGTGELPLARDGCCLVSGSWRMREGQAE